MLNYIVKAFSWFSYHGYDIFLNFKDLHEINSSSQSKNESTSSLDVDLNFSSNKNGSWSSLDVDLNFFLNKNGSASSLDVDLNFS